MQIMRFVVFFIQENLYSNILANKTFCFQFTIKKLRIPYFTSFRVFRMLYFTCFGVLRMPYFTSFWVFRMPYFTYSTKS
jgi:hypothetical protein